MLRFTPIANARHAESCYSKSDGGYYLQAHDLHREWGGKGADLLGLTGPPDYEQFKRLIHGLDPHTGEQLTAKLIEERIPGWDVTASVPKGVTTALERGDTRIRQALWDAGREAMADLEAMATTRVRKGGRQEDRLTGNLLWYAKEDAETRPAKEDKMPDWDRPEGKGRPSLWNKDHFSPSLPITTRTVAESVRQGVGVSTVGGIFVHKSVEKRFAGKSTF